MKKTIFVLLIIINASCRKEDDTALECLSDCTTVQGQLVTAKGEPLANIPVAFNYYVSHGIGASIRRIKKTKTNENGFYKMKFFIENDELGANAEGLFELKIDYGNLDPEVYMSVDPYYTHAIFPINKRDTIITKDFYNPKKAYIIVNLNGFNPIEEVDSFRLYSTYPIGLKVAEKGIWESGYGSGSGPVFRATTPSTRFDSVLVAESDYSRINISRWKNGVGLIDQDTIFFIPEDNQIELNFTY